MSTIGELESFYSKYRILCREFDALSLTDPKFEDKREVVWRKTNELIRETALACVPMQPEGIAWFMKELSIPGNLWEQEKKCFARGVLGVIRCIPADLVLFALRMAVEEPDPSYNRLYVETAVRGLGAYEVCLRLLEVMRTGTNYEKAGALNALYWAVSSAFDREEGYFFKEGVANDSPERSAMHKQIVDEMMRLALIEFVINEDLDLRRSFVRWVSADESKYPDVLRPKVTEAVQIALNHPDQFIRQHMQRQLNPDGLIAPLPPRERPQG